mgnify:CR=1 FL=1|tara:strand:+ start:3369 stop:4319 length:951 start_codon:yes stop_codon:yes gene_type:complete
MSESQTDRVNYSFNVKNDTTSVLRTQFSQNRVDEILVKPVDYEIQAKSFNLDLFGTYMIETSDMAVGVRAFGLPFGNPDETLFTLPLPSIKVYNPKELVQIVNDQLEQLFGTLRADFPTLEGLTQPYMQFLEDKFYFSLAVPVGYWNLTNANPFSVQVYFNAKLNKALNMPTSPYNSVYLGDYWGLDTITDDFHTITNNSINYYFTHGQPAQSFSDIDEIIIQSTSIPIQNTLQGTQKDIETNILKIIRPNYEELQGMKITRDYYQDDFYSLISHYPLKQIDIEFYIVRGGEKTQIDLFPTNVVSCNIEFKKKNIF